LTHSLIVIESISKAESHSTGSDLSTVKAEITTEHFPRALLFAAADPILVTRDPVFVGLWGHWTVAVVATARGIDNRADAATLTLIHPVRITPIGH
jgi:hypothetical protein